MTFSKAFRCFRDAEPTAARFDERVADTRRTCLTLEFELRTDPIAGLLVDEFGERVEFSGWLGLALALEQALTRSSGAGETRPDPLSE